MRRIYRKEIAVQVASPTLRFEGTVALSNARKRFAFLFIVLAAGLTLAACGSESDDDSGGALEKLGGSADATTTSAQADEPPATLAVSNAQLAKSVVLIAPLAEDSDGYTPVGCVGSGTVIDKTGRILTNFHVVDSIGECEYDRIGIYTIDRTDDEPTPSYIADVAAASADLDLAVLQIVADKEGDEIDIEELDLPAIAVGDSDALELGDDLHIMGFPGIGGSTITFTNGTVSGFTRQPNIDGRAWIKTDATIAGGNSGGTAVNNSGELVAIPTLAGSTDDPDAQTVDCRFITDTNSDGVINGLDSCIPVGGFINGLRPVALAADLLKEAEDTDPGDYQSSVTSGDYYSEDFEDFTTEDAVFSDLVFSPGITDDDEPVKDVTFLAEGETDTLCAFWTYDGMIDGVSWDAVWFLDGETLPEWSTLDDTWTGGTSGQYYVCGQAPDGLSGGSYELVVSVAGTPMYGDAIVVGPKGSESTLTLTNDSSSVWCYIYVSPSTANNWGTDDLGSDEVIDEGGQYRVELAAGEYDVKAKDCELNDLFEKTAVKVDGDTEVTIGADEIGEFDRSGDLAEVTVENSSGEVVCHVQISPTSDETWGSDWLDSEEVLPDGESRSFRLEGGEYDMRALDCDQEELWVEEAVEIDGELTVTVR
ncbi:MAG: trypsin-like peptidase domain-containing protein [Acidimicrobiia bacterium]|nr:trypsin-like peptidase domain-containing protein [Acidimicrobiia bacterium]